MTELKDKTTGKAELLLIFIFGLGSMFYEIYRKKRYIPDFKPDSPGVFMKEFLMPILNIRESDVLEKTSLSDSDLQSIFNGNTRIDSKMADKLRPAFGSSADNLCKQQELFDYYSEHGKWPL